MRSSLAAVVLLAAPAPAAAQDVFATTSTSIPEDAGVANSVENAFEPVGGAIGSFRLFPSVSAQATATDNVLATEDARVDDVFATLRASARLVRAAERDRIALGAFVQREFHADVTSENVSEYGVTASGRLGARAGNNLSFDLAAQHLADSRESLENVPEARSPVRRNVFRGDFAATWVFNRLSIITGFAARRIDLEGAFDRSGNFLDQEFRDLSTLGVRGGVRYAFANGLTAIGRIDADRLRYDFGPEDPGFVRGFDRNRDSRRLRAEAGVGAAIDERVYGEFTIGYLDRRFVRQDAPLRNVSGLSFTASGLWNVDRATTVRVDAAREILESASRTIAGFRSTGGVVQVDRAITPRLIATASLRYEHIEPIDAGVVEATRDQYGGSVGARYVLNRRYSVAAQYRHSARDAIDAAQPFSGNYASLELRANF